MRLGLISAADTYLCNRLITSEEYEHIIKELKQIEESNAIVGFVRNLLVSARKT